jgi:hypothetical protein
MAGLARTHSQSRTRAIAVVTGELHSIHPADIAEALEGGAALGAEFYLTDSPEADAEIRMLPGDGLPELAKRIEEYGIHLDREEVE